MVGLDCVGKDTISDLVQKTENGIELHTFSKHMTDHIKRLPEALRPDKLGDASPSVRKTLQMFACAEILVPSSKDKIILGQLIIDDKGIFTSGLVEAKAMLNIMGVELILMLTADPDTISKRREKYISKTKSHNLPATTETDISRIRTHQEMEKRNAANVALNNQIRFVELENDGESIDAKNETAKNVLELINRIRDEKILGVSEK